MLSTCCSVYGNRFLFAIIKCNKSMKLIILTGIRPECLVSGLSSETKKTSLLQRYAGWMSAVVERTLTVRQSLAVTWCVLSFALVLVFSCSGIFVLCLMAVHFLTSLIVARKQLHHG